MSRYQKFFEMMIQEHGITLLEGQMQDIIHEVEQIDNWLNAVEFEIPKDGKEYLVINTRQGNTKSLVSWHSVHNQYRCKGDHFFVGSGSYWTSLPSFYKPAN
jgi:hypothetical protein